MTAQLPDPSVGAPTDLRQRVAELERENARLRDDLAAGAAREAATGEVLRVIASSPTDLQAVLDAVAEQAARLCDPQDVVILRVDGDVIRPVAAYGGELRVTTPLDRGAVAGRAILDRETIHIRDIAAEPEGDFPVTKAIATEFGHRTILATPLLREGVGLGAILVRHVEVRPFTDEQIRLLETFADQAVIAIENAGLFQALQERNRDLAEALDQQTATGEVLKAISRSALDLQSVLDTLVENARRLCDASQGFIFRVDGGLLRLTADSGVSDVSPELRAFVQRNPRPIARDSAVGRAALEGRVVQIPDVLEDPEFNPEFHRLGGVRTVLGVPMLREGSLVGVFALWRREPRPFTDRQVALVTTFADQAVIAIENARLFAELDHRNQELLESNRRVTEALEQQTATGQILRVIASSPTDLQGALDAMVESAARLGLADTAAIVRLEGDHLRAAAAHGPHLVRGNTMPVGRGSVNGRALIDRRPVHNWDDFDAHEAEFPDSLARQSGIRSQLAVPLLRAGAALGTLALCRRERVPFSEQQIDLARTFADQAVIAIENARLFQQLRDRTAELGDLNRTLEARVREQVDELERVGRLRRYLSPQLADLIVSSGDESILESHRRQITVIFCDLRGFTAFAETAEPEEVMGVLGEYHAAMGALIRRYEGTLDRFAGDGLMVLFNDPLPQPDHAARAVRMACAMRERAAELARGWRRQGHELGFGVGIAVGYATLGRIGFEGRYDYTAIGTVANLAARLCGEAAAGQILISAPLHGMVEALVEAEPVGELALKGLHRPVAALNLIDLRDDASNGVGGAD